MLEHGPGYVLPEFGKSAAESTDKYVTAFSGVVAAAAVWSIWGGDMFPPEPDPTGDPQGWTQEEMRRWLSAVSALQRRKSE